MSPFEEQIVNTLIMPCIDVLGQLGNLVDGTSILLIESSKYIYIYYLIELFT